MIVTRKAALNGKRLTVKDSEIFDSFGQYLSKCSAAKTKDLEKK